MTSVLNNNRPYYIAGVGAVIRNSKNLVLAGERSDFPGSWQLPQCTIEAGETEVNAMWREVHEETGVKQADLKFIRPKHGLLSYQIPEDHRRVDNCFGQTQQWYLLEIVNDDYPLDIREAPDTEFRALRWITMSELIEIVVPFRKELYMQLRASFLL
jgi:putative (di)nucleoside polyphosphate hydrolase